MFIIGNKGSFANEIINELQILSKSKEIQYYLMNKEINPAINIKNVYKWIINKGEINLPIIYIGGETVEENKMHLMNVTLPYYLFLIANKNNVRFIYLSSLSIFGLPYSAKVDLSSRMNPQDLYGRTKLLLDELIFSSKNNKASVIFPGSIVTKKRPNFLLKVYKLRDQSPLKFLFRLLPFVGGISISNIKMIAANIYQESILQEKPAQNKVICSKFISLEDISGELNELGITAKNKSVKSFFKINFLPVKLISILTIIFPYKVRKRIIFMLKPIIYKENF